MKHSLKFFFLVRRKPTDKQHVYICFECMNYAMSVLIFIITFFVFPKSMYFFREPFLMVGDLDMVKEILVKEFTKFHDRKVLILLSVLNYFAFCT